MPPRFRFLPLVLPVFLFGCSDDAPPGDPAAIARGRTLAENCRACHDLTGQNTGIGPSLAGILNRPAGDVAGYAYSPGLQSADFTWTPEKIGTFLQDPSATIPETKMAITPLTSAQAADVVAYLRSIDR